MPEQHRFYYSYSILIKCEVPSIVYVAVRGKSCKPGFLLRTMYLCGRIIVRIKWDDALKKKIPDTVPGTYYRLNNINIIVIII